MEWDFDCRDTFRENVLRGIDEGLPGDPLWAEPWQTNAEYLLQMFCLGGSGNEPDSAKCSVNVIVRGEKGFPSLGCIYRIVSIYKYV